MSKTRNEVSNSRITLSDLTDRYRRNGSHTVDLNRNKYQNLKLILKCNVKKIFKTRDFAVHEKSRWEMAGEVRQGVNWSRGRDNARLRSWNARLLSSREFLALLRPLGWTVGHFFSSFFLSFFLLSPRCSPLLPATKKPRSTAYYITECAPASTSAWFHDPFSLSAFRPRLFLAWAIRGDTLRTGVDETAVLKQRPRWFLSAHLLALGVEGWRGLVQK